MWNSWIHTTFVSVICTNGGNNYSREMLSSLQATVLTVGQLQKTCRKERSLCSEIFGSSLQGAVRLSCTKLLTHFPSHDIFFFSTLHFFPSRTYFSSTLKLPSTGPHHYPAFPLPPAPHFVPASSSPFSLKTSFLNSLFSWQNGHS